jgi:hypothetical protein
MIIDVVEIKGNWVQRFEKAVGVINDLIKMIDEQCYSSDTAICNYPRHSYKTIGRIFDKALRVNYNEFCVQTHLFFF